MKLNENFLIHDTGNGEILIAVGEETKRFHGIVKLNETGAEICHLIENDDLSLEMFSDLKPTGDTITTKPITDTSSFIKPLPNTDSITKEDFLSSDTSDIDVIREPSNNKIDNDFFTSSYEFSKKDFTPDDDDFLEEEKSSGLVKIILLFLFIAVLIGVIIYFILNYGIGV